MSIPINVWYYNDLLSEWILKGTNYYQETNDEYKYFRVLSEGKKTFYASANDYFMHKKFSVSSINDNYDENGKINYTNLKGEIIYSE